MVKKLIPKESPINRLGYDRQLRWMERHGVTKHIYNGKCACILGTRKQRGLQCYCITPKCTCEFSRLEYPFLDHLSLWIKNKVPYFFTLEPYYDGIPDFMESWCEEHEMAFFRHNSDVEGWHSAEEFRKNKSPTGMTLFVIMPLEYADTYAMIELNAQRIY